MRIYKTKYHDRLDQILLKFNIPIKYINDILMANPHVLNLPILPPNITITIPDTIPNDTTSSKNNISFW